MRSAATYKLFHRCGQVVFLNWQFYAMTYITIVSIYLVLATANAHTIVSRVNGNTTTKSFIPDVNNSSRSLQDNLDEFNQTLIRSTLELSSDLKILRDRFNEKQNKLAQLFSNLSRTLTQSNATCGHQTFNLTQRINDTRQSSTDQITTQVLVEEVSGNSGMIEFYGKLNSDLRRKIWILHDKDQTYIEDVSFVMEENNLGSSAYLTIWSDLTLHGYGHLYNGSQGDWRTKRRSEGHIIVVTLTIGNLDSVIDPPSFKLRFNATWSTSGYSTSSSEIRTKDGRQFVSYPTGNEHTFPPWSLFVAVVAPRSGRPFRLALTYLDVPVTQPECQNSLDVYFIQEDPSENQYVKLPESAVKKCGQPGKILELIGHSTVAIIRFISYETNITGKGFRMEIDNSDVLE